MAGHNIIERIQYMTQIHKAWDGTEQRLALREKPRRSISYRYTGTETWHSQWIRAVAFAKQGKQIEFPMWHVEAPLTADLNKFDSRIPIRLDEIWGYRDCHGIILWDDDEIGGHIYKLQEVTGSGWLRLAEQLRHDYKAYRFRIVPVFYGLILQDSEYTNETVNTADMVINAEVIPAINDVAIPNAFDEINAAPLVFNIAKNASREYMSQELFMYPPQWVDGEDITYNINADRLDNETGTFIYYFRNKSPYAKRTVTFAAGTRDELYFLERFFYRCKGMLHSFYMPTWTNDFEMTKDALAGQNEVFVKLNIYFQYYSSIPTRRTICVFYKTGTIDIFQIAGYSYSDDRTEGKIFLMKSLSKDLIMSKVASISFLTHVRLDNDEMVINHEANSSAIVEFDIVEVDE